jgi:phospholipid/cholesterol/gamma-HCH transport system permease protein
MRITAQQVYFTGVQSLGVVTLLGFILGSVIVLQSIAQLSKLGGVDELGSLIVVTLIRDVGPLLTILIAIARSATAVAAELATMKVNREVDAIEGLGVSLMEYIIAPRILGGTISVVCTSVWFSTVGIIGGYLVSALTLKLHWSFFMDHLLVAITVPDLMLFVFKTFVGGAVVFAIACLQGLSPSIASYEVPIVTTGCVMRCLVFCLLFHGATTALYYVLSDSSLFSLLGEATGLW